VAVLAAGGALRELDKNNDGKFSRWVKEGWLTVPHRGRCRRLRADLRDIERGRAHFEIKAADATSGRSAPVIQEIENVHRVGDRRLQEHDQRMTPG
jgi:hypothetical protein